MPMFGHIAQCLLKCGLDTKPKKLPLSQFAIFAELISLKSKQLNEFYPDLGCALINCYNKKYYFSCITRTRTSAVEHSVTQLAGYRTNL